MEESRNEVCFKTGLVGFQITMIFSSLCKELDGRYGNDMLKMNQELDENFGCLPDAIESKLQKTF